MIDARRSFEGEVSHQLKGDFRLPVNLHDSGPLGQTPRHTRKNRSTHQSVTAPARSSKAAELNRSTTSDTETLVIR